MPARRNPPPPTAPATLTAPTEDPMAATKYTPEQRATALELYTEHGACEAARRTGITQATISSWARRAGVQSDAPARTAEAVEAARMRWAQRRVELADDIGRVAARLLEAAEDAAARDDGRGAQAFMTGAAIGVDKAELLTGRATSRSVSYTDPSARAAEVAQVRDELADRRDGRAAG